MFERFTARARGVIVRAQEESRALGHSYIGTEHLLLGLIRQGEGMAILALGSLGISASDLRQRVIDAVEPGTSVSGAHSSFTRGAKESLELAVTEAQQQGSSSLGTDHLLLGLIRESRGVAATVLAGLGVGAADVRRHVQLIGDRDRIEAVQDGSAVVHVRAEVADDNAGDRRWRRRRGG